MLSSNNDKHTMVGIVSTQNILHGYEGIDVEDMVRQAIANIGGMGQFVHRGQVVLIKPNAVIAASHTTGVTTDPRIIGALVRMTKDAGAKEIWVAESSSNGTHGREVMQDLGWDDEVERNGGHLIDLDRVPPVEVQIPDGQAVRKLELAKTVLEADVLIDVPKAKTHMLDSISCCIKNWVGIIPQNSRLQYHQMPRLAQVVVDVMKRFPPSLCVVDALIVGEGEGPTNTDPRFLGAIIAGNDPVATEVVVGELLGLQSDDLIFAYTAHLAGLGEIDINKIHIIGPAIDKLKITIRRALPVLYNRFPCNIVTGGACWGGLVWLIGLLTTWEREGTWPKVTEKLGKPTFLIGYNAHDPAFEEHVEQGSYFVVGDCAPTKYKEDSRTIFIPGCAAGTAISETITRLLEE